MIKYIWTITAKLLDMCEVKVSVMISTENSNKINILIIRSLESNSLSDSNKEKMKNKSSNTIRQVSRRVIVIKNQNFCDIANIIF